MMSDLRMPPVPNRAEPALAAGSLDDLCAAAAWPADARAVLLWAGPRFPWPMDRAFLRNHLTRHDLHAYALRRGATGPTLAYGEVVQLAPDWLQLCRLIVDPQQRGRGIGTRLVEDLVACCRLRWPRAGIHLNVLDGNQAALACYHRCDFVVTHTAPQARQYQDEVFDCLSMTWTARR